MIAQSENLVALLGQRFGYTQDNNRDVIGDPMFSLAEATEEIAVQAAYQYLVAHLSRCDEETDAACWGDWGDS